MANFVDYLQYADPHASNYVERYFTFKGPGFIYFSVPKQRQSLPYFDLSFTGNDPYNLLVNQRIPIPRPAWNGIFIGASKNIVENRTWDKRKIPLPNGGPLPRKKQITEDQSSVEFEALLSDHPLLTSYLYPIGASGPGYLTFGGAIEDKEFALTIIRVNDLKKIQEYYEVHHYHIGSIDGVSEITSPHEVTTYKINWSPVAGRNESSCPLPPGQQGGAMWKVSIDPVTGENTLYNPLDPSGSSVGHGYRPFFNT